ncbi:MAG: hypothetical protein HY064_06085 [Bacteroidetes bacterium]|nr:hypothetical protein [Bacteroidota bacterium]
MFKTIATLLLFLSFSTITFSKNDSITTLYQDNKALSERVTELEKQNVALTKENEKTSTRFSDYQWSFQVFLSILFALLVVNWLSANRAARKQAKEELKEMKDEITTKISAICVLIN